MRPRRCADVAAEVEQRIVEFAKLPSWDKVLAQPKEPPTSPGFRTDRYAEDSTVDANDVAIGRRRPPSHVKREECTSSVRADARQGKERLRSCRHAGTECRAKLPELLGSPMEPEGPDGTADAPDRSRTQRLRIREPHEERLVDSGNRLRASTLEEDLGYEGAIRGQPGAAPREVLVSLGRDPPVDEPCP